MSLFSSHLFAAFTKKLINVTSRIKNVKIFTATFILFSMEHCKVGFLETIVPLKIPNFREKRFL
jgi:hypothetical protein